MDTVIHGRSKSYSNGSCRGEKDDVIISYYLRFLIDTHNIAGTRELWGNYYNKYILKSKGNENNSTCNFGNLSIKHYQCSTILISDEV
jgi:hypothetical protein